MRELAGMRLADIVVWSLSLRYECYCRTTSRNRHRTNQSHMAAWWKKKVQRTPLELYMEICMTSLQAYKLC